ncbi:preprotein translocase subunit YajC [Oceanobacter kriegii]|uniref:preprotein translocase subunit YajC n=1 Tax=Oceanobacter kriegii TaxID=64972 RepID=UPI00040E7744|nr:preprotein translocase subunit YajC [Oceanobacter kriegii]
MKALFALIAMSVSSAALAEGAGESPMGAMGQLVFLGGFLLIFYFLLWRPQSKRQKEHKELIGNLNKGDEVVMAGGMLGRVTKVSEDFVVLEVGNGIELPVQKIAVTMVLPKGTIKDVLG